MRAKTNVLPLSNAFCDVCSSNHTNTQLSYFFCLSKHKTQVSAPHQKKKKISNQFMFLWFQLTAIFPPTCLKDFCNLLWMHHFLYSYIHSVFRTSQHLHRMLSDFWEFYKWCFTSTQRVLCFILVRNAFNVLFTHLQCTVLAMFIWISICNFHSLTYALTEIAINSHFLYIKNVYTN